MPVLLLGLLTTCPLSVAADDTSDWPDQIDFDPRTLPNPPAPAQQASPTSNENQAKPATKNKFWPFGRKADKTPPPSDAQITKVGPQDPPASPDPLVRLPVPIQTEHGVLPSGFYLAHPLMSENGFSEVTLTKQNKVMFRCALHPRQAEPTPITPATGWPRIHTEAKLTEDRKAVTFTVFEGEDRYESDPFPIATDAREELKF